MLLYFVNSKNETNCKNFAVLFYSFVLRHCDGELFR